MNKSMKFLNFDFKVLSQTKDASQECVIQGYANTNDKDRVGDVVLPTAFKSSLPTYLKNPVLLENHNWENIAGKTQSAEITDKGLLITARISDTRPDLKTQIREGCLSTFSIGYNEIDSDFDEGTRTKVIKNLELLEISIVSVPANPNATFQEVSGNGTVDAPKDDANSSSGAPADGPAAAPKPDDGKGITPSTIKSAKELQNFLTTVELTTGQELDSKTLIACCDYFNSNEETMTKEELIVKLKSAVKADAPAAAPDADASAKPASDKPAAAPAEGESDLAKVLAGIMDKLNQLGDAVAQLLEAGKPAADASDSEESAAPAAEDAKAEAPAANPNPATVEAPCTKCGSPMTKDEADGEMKCEKCAKDDEEAMKSMESDIAALEAELETHES